MSKRRLQWKDLTKKQQRDLLKDVEGINHSFERCFSDMKGPALKDDCGFDVYSVGLDPDHLTCEAVNEIKDVVGYYSCEDVNFKCLSERQNKILSLYYFEGKTYSQIAAYFDVSEDAIDLSLRRSKKRLVRFFTMGE